ncbi:acyl-CoA dehydrogenase family protein [Prescottella subtropica]|uniref:acyl-CoA dehydrogenase family protein n=1 Tax=Prescottella subtropica TaxID=2545757 RepID=UPI0010F785E1|nr:acyl-CoA dehydrogenase family protein [Prescottella subtropica]
MDFELDDEQKLLRDTTRELLARSYGDATALAAVKATPRGWSDDVWRRLADTGLLGLGFTDEDGGSDAGPIEVGAVMTELGRRLAPEPLLDCVLVPGRLVADSGSAAQRRRILPAVTGGELLLAFAHTEPGMRWPSNDVSTKAVPHGDSWTVTGVKNPVPHGDCAGVLVVSAALPDGGVGLFLVDADAAGVTRRPYRTHDGLRAAQIEFGDAPAESLGEESGADATDSILAAHVYAHAALCAEAVGAMEETLRSTVEYLRTRKQFGVPLSSFQALTHRAADMYVALELARSMSLYATMSLADGVADPVVASRAKLTVGRSARQIGQEAIQMHGGIGMTAEYVVGHYVSRLTAIEHTLGSVDDHVRVLVADVAGHDMVDVADR